MSLVRKGIIGELQVQKKLLELGFNVYNNICDDGGVDLIIEKNNKYYKIQIKRATSISKSFNQYERLSFRLGDTEKRPDFLICEYNNEYWVIPSLRIKGNAFQIYLRSNKLKSLNSFKERWELLEVVNNS